MTRRLLALCALALAACGLNPNALYRCEADSTCAQDGYACWSDGYCHPPSDGPEDAGAGGGSGGGLGGGGGGGAGGGMGGGAGGGGGDDGGSLGGGTGGGGDDAGTGGGGGGLGGGAGGGGGGDDGGTDAGQPDAGCTPLAACPGGIQCGYLDAGCGVELSCGRCTSPMECGVTAPNTCALPRVCTPAGVCWEHPLPQGNSLRSGWPIDSRRVWLAGDNGTLLQWTGERTVLTPAPSLGGTDVLAIHGVSATEAFAVGTNGLLLAWDGTQWRTETVSSGYTGAFNAVAALGGGVAVAVGPNGLVVWRDPTRPTADRWLIDSTLGTTTNLSAVASAGGGVFVAGNRTIYRALNSTSGWMQDTTLPSGGPVLELVESAGALYALQSGLFDGGMGSRVSVRTGPMTWAPLGDAPVPARTLRATGNRLWLAGANSSVMVLAKDGGVVAPSLAGMSGARDFFALAPVSDDEAVVAGAGGVTGFAAVDAGFSEHSLAASRLRLGKLCSWPTTSGPVVVATSATPACPGGCLARLLERRETTRGYEWLAVDVNVPATSGKDTLSCHVESSTVGWATTNSRYVLHRTGTGSWATADMGGSFDNTWYGVWGPPGGPWYFVSDNSSGALMRNFDGGVATTNFVVQYTSTPRLRAITGVQRDNSWAVGVQGQVARLQSSGNTYNTNNGPSTSVNMAAVSATGFPDGGALFVAAGTSGAVWTARNYANSFTASTAPFPASDFRDVWVAPSGDAVLVGDGGQGREPTVLWFQAATDAGLSAIPVPTDVVLQGVYGWADADAGRVQVWLTGDYGTVLTFSR